MRKLYWLDESIQEGISHIVAEDLESDVFGEVKMTDQQYKTTTVVSLYSENYSKKSPTGYFKLMRVRSIVVTEARIGKFSLEVFCRIDAKTDSL